MELDSLRLFAEVARRGSFAAVARDHDLEPSSVSRAVAGIEAALGVRLLQRTTRRMTLTEAGALYLARLEPVLDELARAHDEALQAGGAPSGTLRLSASVSFGQRRILPLLPAFRARYPALGVACVFDDRNVDLVAERIDLAVRLAPAIEGELIATKLVDTRYRVVAAPAYLDAAPPPRTPEQLAAHRCLLFPWRDFRRRWLFRDPVGQIMAVPVAGDITVSTALGLRKAALLGLGPALLADWLIDDDLAAGRLVDLFPAYDVTATRFATAAWLIYPSRAFLPRKVRTMIDFLKETFAADGLRPGRAEPGTGPRA